MKRLLPIPFAFGILCAAFFSSKTVHAQQNLTLYGLNATPSALYLNPGFVPQNKFHISVPLGFTSLSLNNSGFTLNDLLVKRSTDDSLEIRPDLAISKMKPINFLSMDLASELFGLGFKVRSNFFSVSAILKTQFNLIYSKDLFRLINEGNGSSTFLGNTADLSGLKVNMNAYLEYGLGYNRSINEKLTIGGRLKVLSGIANIHTSRSEMKLWTNPVTYDINLSGGYGINSSNTFYFSDSINQENRTSALIQSPFSFKNLGLGIDLGATYKLTEKIELNASIVDLGYITWKNNIQNYSSKEIDYTFKGVDINAVLFDSVNVAKGLQDTLQNIFKNQSNNSTYRTSLYTRFYVSGRYQLNKMVSANVIVCNQLLESHNRMSLAIGTNIKLKNWLAMNVNYAAFGGSYGNIGLGFVMKGGPLQVYFASDNILNAFNMSKSKNMHYAFGINIALKNKKEANGSNPEQKKESTAS
jgi:hypothetical protein